MRKHYDKEFKAKAAEEAERKQDQLFRQIGQLQAGKEIWLPNQVRASEITHIRLLGGYVYLVTIMDLYSRKILAWKVSNTPDAEYCVRALEEAIALHGVPAIHESSGYEKPDSIYRSRFVDPLMEEAA